MKRKIQNSCLLIALSFCLMLPVAATAAPNDPALERAAEAHITKTITESGTDYIAVYQNLDGFIHFVQEEMPDVSELALASFLLAYTNPDHPQHLPEEAILEMLTLSELAVSTQAMEVHPAASSYTLDPSPASGDALERLIITCGRLADAPDHFIMDVTARGLGSSALPRTNTLSIKAAVGADSNYEMIGYLHQIAKTAETEQIRAFQVSSSEPKQEGLTLHTPKKDGFSPSISFQVKAASKTEVYLRAQAQVTDPGAAFVLGAELSHRTEIPPLVFVLIALAAACVVYLWVRKKRGADTAARRL